MMGSTTEVNFLCRNKTVYHHKEGTFLINNSPAAMQVKYGNQKHESWVVHHCIQQNFTAARYTVYFWPFDFTLLLFLRKITRPYLCNVK